jgi:hypothetical protein
VSVDWPLEATQMRKHLKDDERVEYIDYEDDGVIVTLRQGWSFDPMQDNRVAGADTLGEAVDLVRRVRLDDPRGCE